MGDTFRLAMQLTMIDLASGVASRARDHIKQLGAAGKEVAKDFEQMERHATSGLKAIALANYTINKIKPGVASAADLQESMIDVRMSLMRSGQDASVLNRELADVRSTAVDLQKIAPFSAKDVVEEQRELLNAGLEFSSVIGKGGAAWAATALATITKEDPTLIGKALVSTGSVFGVKGSEYRDLADQFQRIGMNSLAKVPDLMEGMKYVGQTAVNMKLSWRDTLAALGTLGEQGQIGSVGGTNLNDFLTRLTGASRITRRVLHGVNQELHAQGKDPLEFWDKNGKLKSLQEIINNLRESMGSFNDHQRMFILEKIFGEQGMRAALALMKEGLGSWEATNEKMRAAASLEQKMDERLKGFNANVTALKGTAKTTLANLFDPALGALTSMTELTNDLVDAVGRLAGEHKGLTATFDAVLGIGAAAAGGYGAYKLIKGGYYGARVLKGLRGLPLVSTGVGVAEGKAVEAATGVKPVFVTNWPDHFGAGAAVANAESIAAGAGGRAALAASMATAGLVTSAIAAPIVSKIISDVSREHGWSSRTFAHNSREYEVMGIAGRHVKNDIQLEVHIDANGRIDTRSNDMNTSIKTLNRGNFVDGMMKAH